MRTGPRRQGAPTWLAWWLMWALILFWPLAFGLPAAEVIWLALAGGTAWLALSGRRAARRR
jgi:hypothetical protein